MEVVILPDPAACAQYAARVVASILAERPGAALGVAAGSTMEPLYTELAKSPAGTERALRVYGAARPGYHSVTRQTIDKILDWRG